MKPTGDVTFLFTDIEGSTKLSQEFPDSYHDALMRHNEILKKAVEHNNDLFSKLQVMRSAALFKKQRMRSKRQLIFR